MTIFGADVDLVGAEVQVDTDLLDGWDAICFEQAFGVRLEAGLLDLLAKASGSGILSAFDRSIVKWLWVRQTTDPLATVADVAATVRAVPVDPAEPTEDG